MEFLYKGLIGAFQLLAAADEETLSAVAATLKVSLGAMGISLAFGIPLGFLLGFFSFPGRRAVRTVVDTLLALPTVLIGLLVYAFVSSRGPLGQFGLLFTLPGIAIGQTILALPIVAALTASSIEGGDPRLRPTLMALGAGRRQVLLSTLWESRHGLLVAAVTAYGRVTTEVGISMMVGGNIKWHTRTMTTAIALETNKGQFAMGVALGLVLLSIAFAVNLSLAALRKR
ncbi:MAG: ABC transporter permease [Pseudomonadota bacterium]